MQFLLQLGKNKNKSLQNFFTLKEGNQAGYPVVKIVYYMTYLPLTCKTAEYWAQHVQNPKWCRMKEKYRKILVWFALLVENLSYLNEHCSVVIQSE